MKLSFSAIAWRDDRESEVLDLLRNSNLSLIEHVPARVRKSTALSSPDLRVIAFQSLLFGTTGLHLFGEISARARMEKHLIGVLDLAAEIGVKAVVFGSPKNRSVPASTDPKRAVNEGRIFFASMGREAARRGIRFCLEPNPTLYECNFLTATMETAEFVRSIGSEGLALNFDLGAVAINQEDVVSCWNSTRDIIGHVHLSEPRLAPVGSLVETHRNHQLFANLLHSSPPPVLSIEMLTTSSDLCVAEISTSLSFIRSTYGI